MPIRQGLSKELVALRENRDTVKMYLDGMSLLQQSGIFSVLRKEGQCFFAASETPEAVGLRGAWSAGFNEALDTLFNFKEIFLDVHKAAMPRMDFGSLSRALDNEDITKEEADAIRKYTAQASTGSK